MRVIGAMAVVLAILCVPRSHAERADKPPLGSPDYAPTPDRPMGWRGDGSGRFPAANPPLTWGRLSTAVKGLSAQATKPKPDDKGSPMPEGVTREWLTLGPVPIPAGKKEKDDFGTGEDKFARLGRQVRRTAMEGCHPRQPLAEFPSDV